MSGKTNLSSALDRGTIEKFVTNMADCLAGTVNTHALVMKKKVPPGIVKQWHIQAACADFINWSQKWIEHDELTEKVAGTLMVQAASKQAVKIVEGL